jgi:hypothetical protein
MWYLGGTTVDLPSDNSRVGYSEVIVRPEIASGKLPSDNFYKSMQRRKKQRQATKAMPLFGKSSSAILSKPVSEPLRRSNFPMAGVCSTERLWP